MFRTIKSWLAADTTSRTQPKMQLGLTALEAREVPAMLSAEVVGNELLIRMDRNGGHVEVHGNGSGFIVVDQVRRAGYQKGAADRVRFEGGGGNDRFANHTTKPTLAYGYGGNDVLVGGGSTDYLDGGTGNDRLNGRGGADTILGSGGDDVLLSIDGGTTDYVDPWSGRDVIWVDKVGSGSDRLSGYGSGYTVQQVGSFANGADRTLDGDRFSDPWAAWLDSTGTVATQYAYRRFDGKPLFSSAGPRATDVVQGALGDCWVVAGAAAVATGNPQVIHQRVVDFDDGTYGVKLGDKFYRVDNDLPVSSVSTTTPVYAQLGAQGSMWVAVLEKAYAHHRRGDNSYWSLNGGLGVESLAAITGAASNDRYFFTYIPNFTNPFPSGGQAILDDIATLLARGNAVTLGFDTPASNCPCVAGHEYSVVRVNRDSAGRVVSVTVRNPWGTDGGGPDGTGVDDANDGFVTLTGGQLLASVGSIAWADVL